MDFTVSMTLGDVLVSGAGLVISLQLTGLVRDVRRLLGRMTHVESWANVNFGFEPRADL